uniref:Uncharacterized protein n=1 Tax=Arundo donax TaxID=35708 RepID=A0A0A9GMR6_ARUDO
MNLTKSWRSWQSVPSIQRVSPIPQYSIPTSGKDWRTAKRICEILDDFHKYMDPIRIFPRPYNLFDTLWDAKKEVHRQVNFHSQTGMMKHFPMC